MINKSKFSILEANLLYLVLAVSLIYLGSMAQNREIYSGRLITEYILILLPNLLYLKLRKFNFKETLKLNKITFKQVLMIITITIFSYPIAIFFQAIFVSIVSQFKEVTPNIVPFPEDGIQYIISFFIIAITPGICEEVMFRGVILNAYNKLGYRKSIIITGVLFGLFHFTILNFVGPAILGIIFGIMVYKTNSLYSSIIAHTVNNGIALTIGYFLNKYGYIIDDLAQESTTSVGTASTIKASIGIITIVGLCILIVTLLLKKLSYYDNYFLTEHRRDILYQDMEHIEKSREGTLHILQYTPIIVVFIMFIYINWKYILL